MTELKVTEHNNIRVLTTQQVAEALPNMSEFDKGYMLGVAESNKDSKKEDDKKKT